MHQNFLNDSDFGNFNVKVLENSGSHWDYKFADRFEFRVELKLLVQLVSSFGSVKRTELLAQLRAKT